MPMVEQIFAARGWLSRQPPEFRSQFIALGRQVRLERNAPVFRSGDPPGGMFGVVSGGVGIIVGADYQEPRLAHIERSGDWFGHGPTVRGNERNLTFATVEPTTLLQVPLDRLRGLLAEDPEASMRISQMVDISLDIAIATARDLLIRDSAQRLAAVLLRVTAMGGVSPDDPDGFLISQADLGEMANISRHQVNRIVEKFRGAGWIATGYSKLRLLDVPQLKAFAFA